MMSWPADLETLTIDQLTDRLRKDFAHWGFFNLTLRRTGKECEYARGVQFDGSRPTVAGTLLQASMLVLQDPVTYHPDHLHSYGGDPWTLASKTSAAIFELLKRSDHGFFVGWPKRPALRETPVPRFLAWTGHLETAVGLAQLGIAHVHQTLCPAHRYIMALRFEPGDEPEDQREPKADESEGNDDGG